MKRIISLLLLLVLTVSVLVGCGENEIGSYLENYPETDDTVLDITLNMYVICEDGTTQNAKETVQNLVKQYTYSKFKTNLIINYVSESDYRGTVMTAVQGDDKTGAHIVLVNSYDLMKELYLGGYTADLTAYYESRDYGRLNGEITPALIAASKIKIDESIYQLHSVPNDHVVDNYEYLVINTAVARDMLHYSNELLSSYKTDEDIAGLVADIEALGLDASELVYRTSGSYELKAEIEAAGNFCNVTKYPTVSAEEAFSSAFVIIDRVGGYVDRAMEVLYEIHNPDNHELRNLIQYGVEFTNYRLDDNGNVVSVTEGDNVYIMNPLYTGNMFYALYSEQIGWTSETSNNGKRQNEQAVVGELADFNSKAAE